MAVGRHSFQFGMGYTVAFVTYQFGTLLTSGTLGAGFIPGGIAVAGMIAYVVYLMKKGDEKATLRVASQKA